MVLALGKEMRVTVPFTNGAAPNWVIEIIAPPLFKTNLPLVLIIEMLSGCEDASHDSPTFRE